jgi:hypothetical protein
LERKAWFFAALRQKMRTNFLNLLTVGFYHIKPYQAAIQECFMARCTKDRGPAGTEDRSSAHATRVAAGKKRTDADFATLFRS